MNKNIKNSNKYEYYDSMSKLLTTYDLKTNILEQKYSVLAPDELTFIKPGFAYMLDDKDNIHVQELFKQTTLMPCQLCETDMDIYVGCFFIINEYRDEMFYVGATPEKNSSYVFASDSIIIRENSILRFIGPAQVEDFGYNTINYDDDPYSKYFLFLHVEEKVYIVLSMADYFNCFKV